MPALRVSQTYDCESNRDGPNIELMSEYVIVMSQHTEGAAMARVAPGVPKYGDQHPIETGARVRRVSCRAQDSEPCTFRAQVSYSTNVQNETDDPLNEIPEVEWTGQTRSIPLERAKRVGNLTEDASGVTGGVPFGFIGPNDKLSKIYNSAGQAFDSGVEGEVHDLVLSFARNQEKYDPLFYYPYSGAVNSATFLGTFGPGVAKCMPIIGRQFRSPKGGLIWRVEHQFVFRPEGWGAERIDNGYYSRDGAPPNKLKQLTDKNGRQLSQPDLLNGAGQRLNFNDPIKAVYLRWATQYGRNFNQLNIELPQ